MSKVAAGVVGFDEALEVVLTRTADLAMPATEQISLLACEDRVLAEAVHADRDQPPFDRSTRDGFAVRAADFGDGPLKFAARVAATGARLLRSLARRAPVLAPRSQSGQANAVKS